MRLYALRHGQAGDGHPDSRRELTDRGRRDLDKVLVRRLPELAAIRLILHSPLKRAVQTAEIAQQLIGPQARLETSDFILPDSEIEPFCAELLGYDDEEEVLICTHNPFVAELVSYLSGRGVQMPTAALAALDLDLIAAGRARLDWLETP